jgi:ATP-dependent Clp protease ATP-binding subunit ClpA
VHTVFERSKDAAKQLGSKTVEPEHMTLALLSVKAGSCYETLKEFSIDPEYVQGLILQAMGLDAEMVPDWF